MQVIDITPKIEVSKKKIRLAAYCRVSSKSEEQLLSYAAQIRYYSEYAKKNTKYELIDIYADKGLTATEMENRDELNRLLLDCKKGKIDRIIVKSMSRFMRNTEECLITLRMLKDIGVSVFFEEQGIDTNKLNSEMIVTFPGMLAQKESENISGNVRWGIRKRMASGTFVCSNPPYGYMLEKGKYVVNENEAKIIRRIFDLYLQGMGRQSIATLLNSEGIPKRNGLHVWHMTAIQYILSNEKYMGDALLQKQYTTDTLPFKQKRNHGERAMYYVENYNPPIVTKEVFQAVQNLSKEKSTNTRNNAKYILSQKLRCPDCGRAFRRHIVRDKAYWCCSTFASNIGCKSRRVREEMVYDTFISLIYKLKYNIKEIIDDLIYELEQLQQNTSENYGRISEIDKQIADLCAKNLVVTRLRSSGALDESGYAMQTSEINNKISELRLEKKKKVTEDESDMMLGDLKELKEIIGEYKLSNKFDEELFEQIVEKIVVEDNTQMTFYLIGGLQLTEKIKEKGRCKTA